MLYGSYKGCSYGYLKTSTLSEKLVLTSVNDFWLNKIAIFDTAGQSNRIKSNIMRANKINGWWPTICGLLIHLDRRPNNDFIIKNFNFFKYPKFLSYISDYQRCPSLCQKWNGQNDFDQFCSAGKKISVSWRKRMEKTGKFELLDITTVNFEIVQTLPRDLIKPWPILVDS